MGDSSVVITNKIFECESGSDRGCCLTNLVPVQSAIRIKCNSSDNNVI